MIVDVVVVVVVVVIFACKIACYFVLKLVGGQGRQKIEGGEELESRVVGVREEIRVLQNVRFSQAIIIHNGTSTRCPSMTFRIFIYNNWWVCSLMLELIRSGFSSSLSSNTILKGCVHKIARKRK